MEEIMVNMIKEILIDTFVIIGFVALTATVSWWLLMVLNKIFKFVRYIIMYQECRKNKELYDLRNKLVVSKGGRISYSCISDLDEQVKILNRAIEEINRLKQASEKYRKRGFEK